MLFCYLDFPITWTRTLKLQIWSIPRAGTAWPELMRVCSARAVLEFWQDNCQQSGSNDVLCHVYLCVCPSNILFHQHSSFSGPPTIQRLKKKFKNSYKGTSITFTPAQNTSSAGVPLCVVDSVSFFPALKYLEPRFVVKISGTILWPHSSYFIF